MAVQAVAMSCAAVHSSLAHYLAELEIGNREPKTVASDKVSFQCSYEESQRCKQAKMKSGPPVAIISADRRNMGASAAL